MEKIQSFFLASTLRCRPDSIAPRTPLNILSPDLVITLKVYNESIRFAKPILRPVDSRSYVKDRDVFLTK